MLSHNPNWPKGSPNSGTSLMHNMIIRAPRPEDSEDICRVHRAAVHALAGMAYRGEILRAWAGRMTPHGVQRGLQAPGIKGFVAEFDDEVVGFAVLCESSVRAIYVHPDFQKRGIGSRLLSRLEEEAFSKGLGTVNLNAALNARSFYEANGYHVVRKTRFPLNEELSMGSLEMMKDI